MSASNDLTARFVGDGFLPRIARRMRQVKASASRDKRALAELRRGLERAGRAGTQPLPARSAGRVDAAAKLRVLSYNVGMLPPRPGRTKVEIARAAAICERILAAEPGFDIVCLQELFSARLRGVVAHLLRPAFPYGLLKSGDGRTLNLDSGLFVASRYPLAGTPIFEQFNVARSWDRLADKGVIATLVHRDSEQPPLVLCNTHLQSDYRQVGEYAEIRRDQLSQIARFVPYAARWGAELAGGPVGVLLVGDLNVVAELGGEPTAEYRAMKTLLGEPHDVYRALNDDGGITWDPDGNGAIPKGNDEPLGVEQRLDYALVFNELGGVSDLGPRDERHTTVVAEGLSATNGYVAPLDLRGARVDRFDAPGRGPLSDHYALIVELT